MNTQYRVSHIEMWKVIWFWQIEICKLDLIWRWFGNPENSEIGKFLSSQHEMLTYWAPSIGPDVSHPTCWGGGGFLSFCVNFVQLFLVLSKHFIKTACDAKIFPISEFQNHLQIKSNLHNSICQTKIIFHISIWDTLYWCSSSFGFDFESTIVAFFTSAYVIYLVDNI